MGYSQVDGDSTSPAPVVQVIGMGKDRAMSSVAALLDGPASPGLLLCIGFTGALRDELGTGDLVISQRHYAVGQNSWIDADQECLSLAQDSLKKVTGLQYFVADTLTVPGVVSGAAEKGRLANASTAWAVNMEDYWTAKVAAERGIPFLSVRAVLDTARQELPSQISRLADKGPLGQGLHLMANAVIRPGYLVRLARLSRQVKVAQDALAAFTGPFVARIAQPASYATRE